ncbi:MAG: cold shock domain-containing protein [Pseudomonadota bacterium]
MKPIVVAVASALLLAVAVTELTQRIWPDSRLALLLLCFLALLISGLFNARQVRHAHSTAPAPGDRQPSPNRQSTPDRQRQPASERRRSRGQDRKSTNRTAGPASRPAAATQTPADGPRETGEVKWFNRSKGFGFVIRPNGEEIFVHQRSIRAGDSGGRPALKDGETVSFVVAQRERGDQAEDVVPERGQPS